MEYFAMRHGDVTCVDTIMMAITFKDSSGLIKYAVASRDVCYVQAEVLSTNLRGDFGPGQRVQFSAVRDPETETSGIWKVLVLWTLNSCKPRQSFVKDDWEEQASKLYTNTRMIQNIVEGRVDIPQQDYRIERSIILYLIKQVRVKARNEVFHSLKDGTVENLGVDMPQLSLEYLKRVYGSVCDFVNQHSTAFNVSGKGNRIYPTKCGKKFEDYLNETLPNKIANENLKIKCDASEIVSTTFLELSLEKMALVHFTSTFKNILQAAGTAYTLDSVYLETLVDTAPDVLPYYIKTAHGSLKAFVEFHKGAFSLGPSNTVFCKNDAKFENYVSENLCKMVKDDPEICEFFSQAIEDRLAEVKENLLGASAEDIYVSEEEDEYLFQSKIKEKDESVSYSDIAVQTYSTGPVEIFSTYRTD